MLSQSGSQIAGYPDVEGGAGVVCGYINEVIAIEHNAALPKMRLYKFPRQLRWVLSTPVSGMLGMTQMIGFGNAIKIN